MSRAWPILAFALPAVGLPMVAALQPVPEPRIEVLALGPEAPCPTVSPLRRSLAVTPNAEHQAELERARDQLWDIPDPIFGSPIGWPDADTLAPHTAPDAFEALIASRLPEGATYEIDCSEYPCFATFQQTEDPGGVDVLGDFLDALCEDFGCDGEDEVASRASAMRVKGYVIYGSFGLGAVQPEQQWRLTGRSAMVAVGRDEPDWLSSAEALPSRW